MDLLKLLGELQRSGVRFVVIGGVAMSLHGSSHVTFDLDIVYYRSPENLERLVAALEGLQPRLRGVPDDVPFRWDTKTLELGMNFTLRTSAGDLDLLGNAPGAPCFDKLESNATHFELGEVAILAASVDDLIRMKTTAGRTKDQLHLLELERLRTLDGEQS